MICNLCKCPTQLRQGSAVYAVHKNADGVRCAATGLHPDDALDKRRTFYGANGRTILRVICGVDGIGINARIDHAESIARIWVTLTPADAVRMAAELIEIAQLHGEQRP